MKNNQTTVPYIVYESALDKAERRDKRNIIVIILLIILLAESNIVWIVICHFCDYNDTTIEDYSFSVDLDDDGDSDQFGNDGDLQNGR